MDFKNRRCLVAYFSHAGENYLAGKMVQLPVGNTAVAAGMIAAETGGELFEIKSAAGYPSGYSDCVEAARRELAANARPALEHELHNPDDYDMIFIGYPNWCGTCPMPVLTFLEGLNLSGKTIAPFCTNEGSGMGTSERDVKKAAAAATVLRGLPIRGGRVKSAGGDISRWLREL